MKNTPPSPNSKRPGSLSWIAGYGFLEPQLDLPSCKKRYPCGWHGDPWDLVMQIVAIKRKIKAVDTYVKED